MRVGFDLQEVGKVENELKLLDKIALESEKKYIQKFKSNLKEKTASLWAVKEAVFKALSNEEDEINFKDIELCHKENGAPYVKLYGTALSAYEKLNANEIQISISHQKNVVGAVVVII